MKSLFEKKRWNQRPIDCSFFEDSLRSRWVSLSFAAEAYFDFDIPGNFRSTTICFLFFFLRYDAAAILFAALLAKNRQWFVQKQQQQQHRNRNWTEWRKSNFYDTDSRENSVHLSSQYSTLSYTNCFLLQRPPQNLEPYYLLQPTFLWSIVLFYRTKTGWSSKNSETWGD